MKDVDGATNQADEAARRIQIQKNELAGRSRAASHAYCSEAFDVHALYL